MSSFWTQFATGAAVTVAGIWLAQRGYLGVTAKTQVTKAVSTAIIDGVKF